jgi:hypothetical protein
MPVRIVVWRLLAFVAFVAIMVVWFVLEGPPVPP